MIREVSGIHLRAIGACLPRRAISVGEYCRNILSERDARRLSKSTGFHTLRIAGAAEKASDLCCRAAEEIFARLPMDRQSIDGLIFVSQTPDDLLPATGYVLQKRLGLSKDLLVFDVNQGCAGYVYGLQLAAALLQSRQCRRVLLCAGDTVSKLSDPLDRSTRAIFGDGGSASLMELGSGRIIFQIESFGGKHQAIQMSQNCGQNRLNVCGGGLYS